jgi:hypothetical protein
MTVIKPTVTDEMIEQGRKALTLGIMGCGCCGDNPPDELDHLDFDVARAHVAARAALEAAAPLIAAQAKAEAWDEALIAASEAGFLPDYIRDDLGNPYREAG